MNENTQKRLDKKAKKRDNIKSHSKLKKQSIQTSFTGGNLTNYSGISTLHKFMEKMGLNEAFNSLGIALGQNSKYDTSTILTVLTLGLQSGMNRLSKIEMFSHDPLLQRLLGLSDKISDSTIINRLKRFTMSNTNEFMNLIGGLSGKIHNILGTTRDILDIDSSVKTVFGNQEGAAKGYNGQKKGAKSYHPMLAFLDSTKECLLSWFRPGNTYTANGADEFLKQTFAMLPKSLKYLLVRADSGFFSGATISVIENAGFDYLIKLKARNAQEVLKSQDWQRVPGMPNYEICDFDYQLGTWNKSRHFSAVRILELVETEGQLFPKKVWKYFCYCTNVVDNPLQIHRLYGDRGTSENWIENVKSQMFGGQLLTNNFWANEALWQASVLAYNLSLWMRKLSDEKSWHEEPATFRTWFVQLAGKVITSGRRVYLKMYKAYYYKEKWRKIETAVDNISFA